MLSIGNVLRPPDFLMHCSSKQIRMLLSACRALLEALPGPVCEGLMRPMARMGILAGEQCILLLLMMLSDAC